MDFATLLDRCRQGDELAWEALVRGLQARVYGFALHYLRDPEEARDLAQDVFIRIYRNLGTAVHDTTFVSWVLRLTRNACIDRLRRRKTRPQPAELDLEQLQVLAPDAGPEQTSLLAARDRLLYRALGEISESHREILLLKEIQGMDLPEISKLLAVPLGTLKSRAHRARIELVRAVLALDPSYGA